MGTLQRVTSTADIATTASLARIIWTEHYVPIIGPAQVAYMLDTYQSEAAIRRQLTEGYEYYLAMAEGEAVGYLAIQHRPAEEQLFLSKIYTLAGQRGKGYGKDLLQLAERRAAELGAPRLVLTVNKHNNRSIAWYERQGFRRTEAIVTDIGQGFVMDDFRLVKELTD